VELGPFPNLLENGVFSAASKAAVNFWGLAARLEAAPFQNGVRGTVRGARIAQLAGVTF
jgi:hypothetical protein